MSNSQATASVSLTPEQESLAHTDDKHLGEELNLRKKLLQESVVKRITQVKENGSSKAPWVVELDPTSACNLVCPDCISKDLLNQGGFENQRLRDLAREIVDAGVRAVILIGGGEPMAHREFGWIVRHFGENGVHVGVTTNGTLIHRFQDELAEHTKWVRVSIDAGTPETFQHFRPSPNGISKFDQVIENMRNLAKVKTGKLGYSFLLLTEYDHDRKALRSNFDEIYQAAEIAKDIGCEYFEVKPSYDFDHYLIEQPEDLLNHAKREIERARQLSDENFRVITPATLNYVLNNLPLIQPKEYSRCMVAELRTLVTPSGAYVCPYFRGHRKKVIGDPTTQSFQEIWDSEQRRKATEDTDPSRDCRFHCIRHRSNLFLEEMIESDQLLAEEDYDFFV
jgi:MoaA/NifB/PqqE/SkfB family radical SAM enzyme